jgi:endonuclease/exonuclease/phosphatase family metal-dependent hydrolase
MVDKEMNDEFKILTLNLLFDRPTTADNRFNNIAQLVVDRNIDCVLVQEVSGGILANGLGLTEKPNSALELKETLSKQGEKYKLRYRLANGIPLLFSVGIAILFKEDINIVSTFSKDLPSTSELNVGGIDLKLKRKAMGSLIDVPVFGKMLVFNTHLCASCPPQERQTQIEAILKFEDKIKSKFDLNDDDIPSIFGGDFNIRETDAHNGLTGDGAEILNNYNTIVNAGFLDSYSEVNGCRFGDCCNPPAQISGCTNDVDDPDDNKKTRVDYIFVRPEDNLTVDDSLVVLNGINGPFVSNHSGVLTIFKRG